MLNIGEIVTAKFKVHVMPKVKLTALAVEKIQSPEKGQVDYFDAWGHLLIEY